MSNEYSTEQVKLHDRIRKITSRIGKAKKAGDQGSVANYRDSRNRLLGALADRYDTYYWVNEDGKSQFGSLEDAQDNVDPEQIKVAAITSHLYEGLRIHHKTRVSYRGMTAEELQKYILEHLDKRIGKMSEELHEVQEKAGETKADLSFLEDDENIDGIDWDSLNEDEEQPTKGVIEEADEEPKADEPETEGTNS